MSLGVGAQLQYFLLSFNMIRCVEGDISIIICRAFSPPLELIFAPNILFQREQSTFYAEQIEKTEENTKREELEIVR